MSCEETKISLRMKIPELTDTEKAYWYFTKRLRSPDETDEHDGKIQYFSYDDVRRKELKNESGDNNIKDYISVVRDYKTGQYGIEVVIAHMVLNSYESYGWQPNVLEGYPVNNTEELREKVLELGFPDVPMYLHAYTWYNGVDEPIQFGD